MAGNLVVLGKYAEALNVQQHVLGCVRPGTCELALRLTLSRSSNLEVRLQSVRRHAEGIELHERMLKLSQRELGPEDPDTISRGGNLADARL